MSKTLPLGSVIRNSNLTSESPLLILLHGYGSDENDLFTFANEMPKELLIISLRAPHKISPYGYAWYAINFDADQKKWNNIEQAKNAMKSINKCIETACSLYNINNSNISILGFSQGCILSIALALNYPKKFKNIIGLSGYICEDFLNQNFQEENHEHLDFYCSHGSSDQVIPVEWSRKTPKFLKRLKINCKYSEFPTGHGITTQNLFEVKEWLKVRI